MSNVFSVMTTLLRKCGSKLPKLHFPFSNFQNPLSRSVVLIVH